MAPKKKGNKMALGDFLQDESMGNWADDDLSFPTMPTQSDPLERLSQRAGRFNNASQSPSGSSQPQRPQVPLPTNPPFTAYLGNLSFDVNEKELVSFLGGESVVQSVRLVRGQDDNFRGFGYAEFHDVEGLKNALTLDGKSVLNRNIRINVAEASPKRQEDEKFSGAWRREGPISRGPPRGEREQREKEPEMDLDKWSTARGAKFAPSKDEPASGPPSHRNKWGNSNPRGPGDRDFSRPSSRTPSNHGEDRPPPPPTLAESTSQWRRTEPLPPSAAASSRGSTPPTSSSSPQAGRRGNHNIDLAAARSTSVSSNNSSSSPASTNKPNPFGAAAPVDTAAKEREIEQKMSQREKETKPAAPTASSNANSASSAAKKVNPFGTAAPVDTLTREREIERRLEEQKKKDAEKAESQQDESGEKQSTLASSTTATSTSTSTSTTAKEEKKPSAPPQNPWRTNRTPSSTSQQQQQQQHGKPQQQQQKSTESKQEQSQEKEKEKQPAKPSPKFIEKPSLRKEGFSYSNMASSKQNGESDSSK